MPRSARPGADPPHSRSARGRAGLEHILTVDVEEWFHLLDVKGGYTYDEWDALPSRVVANTDRLLELFAQHGLRATFFLIGWVAERNRELVRKIAAAGHEIGSHSYWHELASRHDRASFRQDLERSRKILEDIVGRPIRGFRAPGFSITPESAWTFDLILEQGFQYDSSLWPGRSRYGGYKTPLDGPHLLRCPSGELVEIPASTRVAGVPLPYSGGGYLRLLPERLIRSCIATNERRGIPTALYVHPRDFDDRQPRLRISPVRKFRSYVGLGGAEHKLRELLGRFRWISAEAWIEKYGTTARERVLDVRAAAAASPAPESARVPAQVPVRSAARAPIELRSARPEATRILVLTERFFPEVTAPSVRVLDHARIWLAMGHEVTVVTCVPNFPRGVIFEGYRNRLYQEEWIEGIRVIRVGTYTAANEGFAKRILDYLSYMGSATLQSPRFPDFDVLLATSPPLFTALAGYLVSRIRRRPWVFELRDLWPASLRAVGAASQPRLIGWLEKLELFLYRKADRIVSLTHSFQRDLERRGIPAEKTAVVTNGVDFDRFQVRSPRAEVRARLGVPDDVFLAGYIGTIGMAHGLATLLDAAELTRPDPTIRFLIMGDGAERKELEEQALHRGLDNVVFHGFVPHVELPGYLAALDASIVHLRPDPLFTTVIPSKIFEAMAVGVPILMAVEGEAAEIVASAGAGVCLRPGDPGALVEAVRKLAGDPGLCAQLASRGREAARTQYSRRPNALAVIEVLEDAVQRRQSGREKGR